MIKVLKYHKQDMSWGSLKDLDSNTSIVWVDCLNPSKEDLELLSDSTCVNIDDIRECLDPNERPRISEFKDYTVIAFRSPYYDKHQVITITIGIILLKYGIVTLRTHNIKALGLMESFTKEQNKVMFKNGPSFILYRLLNFIIDDYFGVMDKIEESLDRIENRIFKGEPDNIMKSIFKLKKTLIYFHKALTSDREVITLIDKEFVKELKKEHAKKFRYLYNDINELIDIESTYKDILTGQIEIYLSSVSNSLNVVMKKITAIASFVLIPTLISGIYGMNFRYMPELGFKYGYYSVLGLMVGSVFLLFLYFRKKKYL